MEIWLNQGAKSFRFAVLPSEYELTSESDNKQVNINALGEINLLGKRKLKSISLSSFFPYQVYDCCQFSSFPTPEESVAIIEEMKENGVLSLIMTGTPVNMDCTIESFTWGENDATKDISFTIEFKEYRRVKVRTSQINEAVPERPAKEVTGTTYTVVKGDNLSKIAKNLTGNSANWKTIYEQNKGVIGSNPNLIYPGQQLVINI